MEYQYVVSGSTKDLGGMIDGKANGYAVEMLVSRENLNHVFTLTESVNNGKFISRKWWEWFVIH